MAKSTRPATLVGTAVEGVGDIAGYIVTAPTRIPVFRELLKGSIKVGFRASHLIRTFAGEQGRQWQEVVKEARDESRNATGHPAGRQQGAPAAHKAPVDVPEAEDLEALEGVGPDTARLFRSAGIRSVRELANHNPEALRKKLKEVNDRKSIVHNVPSVTRIGQWVEKSKSQER